MISLPFHLFRVFVCSKAEAENGYCCKNRGKGDTQTFCNLKAREATDEAIRHSTQGVAASGRSVPRSASTLMIIDRARLGFKGLGFFFLGYLMIVRQKAQELGSCCINPVVNPSL